MNSEFLKNVVDRKRQLIQEKEAFYASLKEKLSKDEYTRYKLFERMIARVGQVNLIAEIKKASPSKGVIREDFDIMEIATSYVENQTAAISILTEEKYFLGKPAYVKQISDYFNVPVLAKDFIIHEGQIYEARFLGACAILLIVSILSNAELKHFLSLANSLDLDCLVEIHNEEELRRALKAEAQIIGVNNRNLHTFEVDLKTSQKLIPQIPKDKIIVAESGIHTQEDVNLMKNLGAHAVLIGEVFMKEKDIGAKVREVMGFSE